MEIAKFISRKPFALQCFLQGMSKFHSVSLTRQPASRVITNPHRLNINAVLQSPLKVWDKHLLVSGSRKRLYSSEASSSSDKQEKSPSTQVPSDEKAAHEEEVESVEASGSDESSVNTSESEELVPSEQEESENNKLDKLYKVIELEVLAYEPSVLDSYQWFVVTAATHLGIQVGKCWSPERPEKMRFHVLKSAFVHKKHVVHYEVRTHHRFLTFHKLTSSTADTFLEYIERNLPEGVGLKVTRVEAKAMPDYLQKQAQQQQQ